MCLCVLTSSASLAHVHGGQQAVLAAQQVRKVVEDGGKLQEALTAADVPQPEPGLLWAERGGGGGVRRR